MVRSQVLAVRVSQADLDALKNAAAEYRRRTGAMVTVSDLLRWGANAFTSQVGINLPSEVKN
jgi:hypothetical protein